MQTLEPIVCARPYTEAEILHGTGEESAPAGILTHRDAGPKIEPARKGYASGRDLRRLVKCARRSLLCDAFGRRAGRMAARGY